MRKLRKVHFRENNPSDARIVVLGILTDYHLIKQNYLLCYVCKGVLFEKYRWLENLKTRKLWRVHFDKYNP